MDDEEGGRGLAPSSRRHVEAYPRLFAQAVVSNWRSGKPRLIWRDQTGTIIGRANVDSVSTALYGAEYAIYPGSYYPGEAGVVNLPVKYPEKIAKRQRAFFSCPECNARVGQLVLRMKTWACTKCNHLVNRSALIGTPARRGERLLELEKLIGIGRPKHMQSRRYDRLRTELVSLRMLVGPTPLVAHAGYTDIITEEWHRGPAKPFTGMTLGITTLTGGKVIY